MSKVKRNKITDDDVVRVYIGKKDHAKHKDIYFALTLQSIRNMLGATKCHFSGLPLNRQTFSIDRVNSNKGYIIGNVVACHSMINNIKGTIENPASVLTFDMMLKVMKKCKKAGLK